MSISAGGVMVSVWSAVAAQLAGPEALPELNLGVTLERLQRDKDELQRRYERHATHAIICTICHAICSPIMGLSREQPRA